ncbi:hypothetical protein A5621_13525 [Mycobacterium colombiense]|nr:hypothetical protein A5621_13525 [Mycobacterium colombiense]
MRWVTYPSSEGQSRVGLIHGEAVHGLEPGVTMQKVLNQQDGFAAAYREAIGAPTEVVALDQVRLEAPLQPSSIRDCLGFLQHLRNCAEGAGLDVNDRYAQVPAFYFSNHGAVIGPYDDVAISPGSSRFDYELEVCAVIGKSGSNISYDDAPLHIAGYTILCDWSARDLQVLDMSMGLGPGKGKDGATTLGPMLVTPDELALYQQGNGFALTMTAYINGEETGAGRWDQIDWDFADMIVYLSRGTSLRPGDVIGSGTVPTGCLFEHFVMAPDTFRGWLSPGDEVRLVVEELGEIRNRVVAGSPPQPLRRGHDRRQR